MDFERPYDRADLEDLFDEDFFLPDGFMFGVANAAFQVEGGFNGPGQPMNNWVVLERSGKVEPSGEAIRFWEEYPQQVELASAIGLNAFRLGIEWARVQPHSSARAGTVPAFDAGALEGYASIIAAIMDAGMEPVVTVHHFTHPYWLGLDFWLENDKLVHFDAYVRKLAEELNRLLLDRHGKPPVRYWVTINEPNAYCFITYAIGYFPHRRFGIHRALKAWNNQIEAHCRAYDIIHGVYAREGWGEPMVAYNTINMSAYYLDKFMTDLLNARRNGVEKKDLGDYLEDGRRRWNEEIAKSGPGDTSGPGAWMERLVDEVSARFFSDRVFAGGIDALYASDDSSKLDYVALDFYDPFLRDMVRAPGIQDLREGRLNMNAEHWQWRLHPPAFYHFLKAETINSSGLPMMVAENGLCNKVYRGRVERREDGATRDVFLKSFIYEALRALKDGVPLFGYLYWTLVDNYEWGSYEPRFGLYTVDRAWSPVRISPVDSWGIDAGGAYRDLVAALRSGDRAKMVEAFSA